MEKLEDINEIDEINNQVVIEENEDEIIKKTLEKLNKDQVNDILINELSECYKSRRKPKTDGKRND